MELYDKGSDNGFPYEIYKGDSREMGSVLKEESVDSIVTDPPYELGFMNRKWDGTGIAFDKAFWAECLKVLKPGGYLLAFGGSRTFHRIACAIEDAGFEIRDTVMWLYGSGFPKSHNVGLAIDGKLGKEAPNEWKGWGTALKPAYEPIIVARKPLCGSVADNVLEYGTGAINVDGCRADGQRFPSNVITDGSEEVTENMPVTGASKAHGGDERPLDTRGQGWGFERMPPAIEDGGGSVCRYFYCAKVSSKDRDEGLEGFEAARRTDGRLRSNSVSARKFGANSGLSKNPHPTVKPTELMQYLVRLVTPKGGKVLDPFMGSGSTGKACAYETRERKAGYSFVGIEMTEDYLPVAKARIEYASTSVLCEEKPKEWKGEAQQLSLF